MFVKLFVLVPTWADIDDNNRRIRIRKSKTDKATGNVGATIVLPAKAKALLLTLAAVVVNGQGTQGGVAISPTLMNGYSR